MVRRAENGIGDCPGTKYSVKVCRDATWIWMGVNTGSMHLVLVWGVYTWSHTNHMFPSRDVLQKKKKKNPSVGSQ